MDAIKLQELLTELQANPTDPQARLAFLNAAREYYSDVLNMPEDQVATVMAGVVRSSLTGGLPAKVADLVIQTQAPTQDVIRRELGQRFDSPRMRAAARQVIPQLQTQYLLQEHLDPLNPAGSFAGFLSGSAGGAYRGEDLTRRLGELYGAMQFADAPPTGLDLSYEQERDIIFAEQFRDAENAFNAFTLPTLQNIAPALRPAYMQAQARRFDNFMYNNPNATGWEVAQHFQQFAPAPVAPVAAPVPVAATVPFGIPTPGAVTSGVSGTSYTPASVATSQDPVSQYHSAMDKTRGQGFTPESWTGHPANFRRPDPNLTPLQNVNVLQGAVLPTMTHRGYAIPNIDSPWQRELAFRPRQR